MSNDSAQGRAVGAHPGSFSGGENFRWTSWAQTDSDPLCARSGTVDSQHRRAMAHAAAELPELQNCASAFSELVMIVSSHGLFKLTGYLAIKRIYIRLFNDGKDSTSVSFPLQPLRPHNARTRARPRPRLCNPMARAAASTSLTVVSTLGPPVGLTSTATRVAAVTSSRRSSSRFATTSPPKKLIPVRLPPGRARLATRPSLTGSSATLKMMGIVAVAVLAANAAALLPVEITATRRRTNLAASSGSRSI